MANPKIKATYNLDVETVSALESLALRWGVPRSEALRRVIRRAAEDSGDGGPDARLEALDELQRALALSPQEAQAWADRVRDERYATTR